MVWEDGGREPSSYPIQTVFFGADSNSIGCPHWKGYTIQSTFWPLKNVSNASIITPVTVSPLSFAYFSARSANRQGRWIVISWVLSGQEIGLD